VPAGAALHVVGDLHGQLPELNSVLRLCGAPVAGQNMLLFNGDFVDRGPCSTEVVLSLFALAIACPKAVFLNRGNHETRGMNRAYGFEQEVAYKYSEATFEAIQQAFAQLPLATLVNKSVLVMHGGLPGTDGVKLADIAAIKRLGADCEPRGLAHDLMWADPCQNPGLHPSPRGGEIQLFGPDITERFCDDNKLLCIIRSHEVVMNGYAWQRGGRCVTVFSAANYVGRSGNLGAVCHLRPPKGGRIQICDIEFTQFEGAPSPPKSAWRVVPAKERSRL